MDLSIAGLSTTISQADLQTDFGVKMLANTLDTSQQVGQEIVNMIDAAAMERSVNPAVGGNFDMSV